MKQTGLVVRPITTAAHIGTKPAPGVMPTSPATMPVQAPMRVGLPFLITSQNIQESSAAAAEAAVVMKACAARPSAASAEPALKPNQPNISSDAPIITVGILCIL